MSDEFSFGCTQSKATGSKPAAGAKRFCKKPDFDFDDVSISQGGHGGISQKPAGQNAPASMTSLNTISFLLQHKKVGTFGDRLPGSQAQKIEFPNNL